MSKVSNLTAIIDYTALACQQPRPVTNSACQVMLEHISEHLSRGNSVHLHGFGSFKSVDGAVQFTPSKKMLKRQTIPAGHTNANIPGRPQRKKPQTQKESAAFTS